MRDIELTPGYSTREIPGRCLKCLADHEYTDCLRALLGGETENEEMRQTYEALVSFLQSPDMRRLRDESERLLADGKKVTVRISFDDAEPRYELRITEQTEVVMRYAVPVTGGILSPHFGHCEQFALIDVDEKSRKVIKKQMVPSPEHQPGLLPGWLAQQGVQFIIAGGMGSRAQDLFQQNRIGVVVGAMETDPEKAVLSHLSGKLATGDNACDH